MKKFLSFTLILCFAFFTACNSKTESKKQKTTNDALSYYSNSLNQTKSVPTNNVDLSTSLKKGDICKLGIFDQYYDNFLNGNPLENIGDSFNAIFGNNTEGLVFVIKVQEVENCVVWIDQWTNNPNGGDTTISQVSELAISSTIKNSLSFNAKYAAINCEKAVSNTQKYVNETMRQYKYNLENYNTTNYQYAWSVIANTSIYRIMFYKFKFWKAEYEYVSDTYEIRINENNPDWERRLLYRSKAY